MARYILGNDVTLNSPTGAVLLRAGRPIDTDNAGVSVAQLELAGAVLLPEADVPGGLTEILARNAARGNSGEYSPNSPQSTLPNGDSPGVDGRTTTSSDLDVFAPKTTPEGLLFFLATSGTSDDDQALTLPVRAGDTPPSLDYTLATMKVSATVQGVEDVDNLAVLSLSRCYVIEDGTATAIDTANGEGTVSAGDGADFTADIDIDGTTGLPVLVVTNPDGNPTKWSGKLQVDLSIHTA